MSFTVFVGTSLDGFLARADGALDFLDAGSGEDHGYDALFASVDALVMGRKTFETVLGFDGWPYGTKPVVVLSSRELPPAPPGAVVERMSGDPGEIAARLAARGFEEIYLDGGETIRRFLAAGLVGRLVITRVPVLVGSGVPLFGDLGRDVPLRHVATRTFAGGLVQSEYLVTT